MKKLLLASVTMMFFSFSVILFQISCKKDAKANITGNSDIIPFVVWHGGTNTTIYTVNKDGTNLNPLSIANATGVYGIVDNKIIFAKSGGIYNCNIDGTNEQLIKAVPGTSYQITF